jgi:hypothetical protein
MTRQEFGDWVGVLREHQPDHPQLKALGTTWYAGRRRGLLACLRAWLGW